MAPTDPRPSRCRSGVAALRIVLAVLAVALSASLTLAGPRPGPGPGPGPGCGHGPGKGAGAGCCAERAGAGGGGGCRRGLGGAGGTHAGPGRGRAMDADGHHDVIQSLLGDHDRIRRQVEVIDAGIVSTTTSEDPEIAAKIRQHVRQMAARVESGRGVRHWDPLFAEIFEYHDRIRMEIEDVPGGVRVRETTDDPEVKKLIEQHALRGVSEFVERGHERAREATPMPEGYRSTAPAEGATN